MDVFMWIPGFSTPPLSVKFRHLHPHCYNFMHGERPRTLRTGRRACNVLPSRGQQMGNPESRTKSAPAYIVQKASCKCGKHASHRIPHSRHTHTHTEAESWQVRRGLVRRAYASELAHSQRILVSFFLFFGRERASVFQ